MHSAVMVNSDEWLEMFKDVGVIFFDVVVQFLWRF